jgi:hypothetical protein
VNLADEASSIETSFFITSLGPERAGPEELADLVRGHWGIENRIHWERDVTFDDYPERVIMPSGRVPQLVVPGRTAVG